MSDHTSYEEQNEDQLHELPMPDMDLAWQDMEQRLGKEKRRRLLPPIVAAELCRLGWSAITGSIGLWFGWQHFIKLLIRYRKQTVCCSAGTIATIRGSNKR
jgi:hypothetical protein